LDPQDLQECTGAESRPTSALPCMYVRMYVRRCKLIIHRSTRRLVLVWVTPTHSARQTYRSASTYLPAYQPTYFLVLREESRQPSPSAHRARARMCVYVCLHKAIIRQRDIGRNGPNAWSVSPPRRSSTQSGSSLVRVKITPTQFEPRSMQVRAWRVFIGRGRTGRFDLRARRSDLI
jgi:hypothetical protein